MDCRLVVWAVDLKFRRVNFDPRPTDVLQAVWDRGKDRVEALGNGLRGSGQVQNKCLFANTGDLSRQNGRWDFLHTYSPHLFAESRQQTTTDLRGRFRCDVARGRPGSARRHDKVATHSIDKLTQGVDDPPLLVVDQSRVYFERGCQRFREVRLDRWATAIFIFTAKRAIGNRNDTDFQNLGHVTRLLLQSAESDCDQSIAQLDFPSQGWKFAGH